MATTTTLPTFSPPQFGTSRTDRATHGANAEKLASKLGIELMPWQQHVLDVALEVDDDGKLVYRHIGLSVPRQSGKSTLMFVLMTLRGLTFGRQQRIIYTAQDRMAAREKWEEDHVESLRAPGCALREDRDFTVRLSNGTERIRFNRTGSIWRISSTTDTAGHGKTLDLAVIDEAFSHTDTRVDSGFSTPMITRAEPQLWVVSTAGTWESRYLNGRRKRGRAAALEGRTSGVAWFEWSKPDDADFFDTSRWSEYMPAVGHTQTVEAVQAEIENMEDPADALRAYGNITVAKSGDDTIHFDVEAWGNAVDVKSEIVGDCAFGVGVAPDRSRACIGVAGWTAGGALHVEFIEARSGTTWVPGRLSELVGKWGSVGVGVYASGPASSVLPDLPESFNITKLSGRTWTGACTGLHDRVTAGEVVHLNQPELDQAVEVVKRRPAGESWAWHLTDVDVSALEAVTAAAGALAAHREPEAIRSVYEDRGFLDW